MKCTATAKHSGDQCKRDAIRGGNVCRYHGGAAPQVQMAAARRVLEGRLTGQAKGRIGGTMEGQTLTGRVEISDPASAEECTGQWSADRAPVE